MYSVEWIQKFVWSLSKQSLSNIISEEPSKETYSQEEPSGLVVPTFQIRSTLTIQSVVNTLTSPSVLYKLAAHNPDLWGPVISEACVRYEIVTPYRVAAFLANILVETGGFLNLTENFNYDPASLLKQWPKHFTVSLAQEVGRTSSHPADQKRIAEYAYGGRMGNAATGSGDGWLYRGRGIIQLTGKQSYQEISDILKMNISDMPDFLERPSGAAMAAGAFWKHKGCNEIADRLDIEKIRKQVNGGVIGLEQVKIRYKMACTLFNV